MTIKVIFFGTPTFSTFSLKALISDERYKVTAVITQPDKPRGRGRRLTHSPVKEIALENDIPVIQPNSIRKEEKDFLSQLDKLGTHDIAVVSAFGQIIPESTLYYPSHDSINIHGSLLPRWRGAAPIQRAIMAGDKTTGICLMKMDTGLDTGAVYSSAEIPIKDEDTTETLHDKLAVLGAQILVRDLPSIISNDLPAEPQPEIGITYAKKITSSECKIDWSADAGTISKLIKGLSPAPAAFSKYKGKRIKIFFAEAQNEFSKNNQLKPGVICMVDKNQVHVQCGKDIVSLGDVQLEGKKRMSAKNFISGYNPQIGDSFSGNSNNE